MKKIFSDPTIPAFFQTTQKPFTITPQQDQDGRVVFHVEGRGIDEALQELYSNPSVKVLDFIRSLKGFRSCIFQLKNGGGC